ncbi:PAS domain S-box-containing protein/diguanylate cyclase (GGDEF) domain-containing protein [Rugamonas rubra]|uniref:PAS domain S-box-containing protein/diguanylate cyclase (GGDEF) domain-containing protein n=2 Tax=Rugamonas rubra TaxID=758825 RepID=A0A1I4MYY4_9BURK|nr:PAS domain S-box-containing protein/diguanylate cyclase (GGDEF) domain-containing protein [Rugamonas rubra]
MPLLRKLLSSWLRMGTYTRLFVPIFALIAVVVCVRYSLLIEAEAADANLRYQLDAQELGDYLNTTLKSGLALPDRAALETALAGALLLNQDASAVRLDYPGGHLEAVRSVKPEPTGPAWFQALHALQPLSRELALSTNATLEMTFEPTLPLNRVWHTVRQQAQISALNVGLIYLLLGLLIYSNKRMLARLARATDRFQAGEHGVRLPLRGTLEARALAATFNNMAQEVQALVGSLQRSQRQLGEQLAQTRSAQAQLLAEKERIEVTLASIGDAVVTTDLAGRILTFNAVAQTLTGLDEAQARGMELHQAFVLANNFGQHSLLKAMAAIYAGGAVVKAGGQSLRHLSGQVRMVEYTAAAIRDSAGRVQGSVLVFRDVSEKRHLIQQMSWQSNHDVLTGLPNRAALSSRFEQELEQARERQQLLAVCLFDLDHFQGINQGLGQAVGDEVLKQVASRLHDFAGQRHYVARLGGDEFVLLLPQMDGRGAVEQAMARLLAALALDYQCDGETVKMSASVGVALYRDGETSADQLLRHADQALYQAKITGRNRYHFFDADLDEQVRTHHNRRTEVRAALRGGEMRLYYQPKLNMRRGRIVGMEALLRWQHPERGVVGPMDFLPFVEHTDLIVDIGEWVLREALRQLQSWRGFDPDWVVSVNIAARHFQRNDFVERLTAILAEFPDVPPYMLELEILESSALSDVGHVRAIMLACQALGISFALDDFGTGYSSMSYLKRLPADVLKVDQSFVRNMLVDRDDRHLVSAVIGLARAFELGVIAEGVETVAHGALLMRLGCDLAQGFGIARPMPSAEVLPWVSAFDTAPVWQAAALLPPIAHQQSDDGAGRAQDGAALAG